MNIAQFVSGNIGIVHLIFSILSLVFGTLVLVTAKGTKQHKKMGYYYSFSMLVLLVTAFMLYNLFGKFGIFHWAAVLSSLTLIGGLVPMFLKKPSSYVTMHFNFMYWSVFGLYGAFVAEVLTRIPDLLEGTYKTSQSLFFSLVGVAVFVTMGAGYVIMVNKKKTWRRFEKKQN